MGGVFARAFLRAGFPVHPITREMDIIENCGQVPDPEFVLVAVGENDLQAVLNEIPPAWKYKLCLLQNELLPKDLQGLDEPTVISVWFEKKPGMEVKVIVPSPIYGPQSERISKALMTLKIPTKILTSPQELLFELVLKNIYILTSNICRTANRGYCRRALA